MKKLPIYLLITVALSVAGAFLIDWLRRRNEAGEPVLMANGEALEPAPTFKNFNYNKLLNARSVQAVPEITALQYLINDYYGEPVLTITGTFDDATLSAVKDITGKASTNLWEFRYMYHAPKKGDKAAAAILEALTTPAA